MKKTNFPALFLFPILLASHSAQAANPTFESITCRSYDYYQLGGDRKVLEVAIAKGLDGGYRATMAHAYEVLQPDHSFRERSRTTDLDVGHLTCQQASAAIDPKVITCATGSGAENYVGIVRNDKTVSASAFSSTPGKVFKTSSYEVDIYSTVSGEFANFDPENCVLN